MRLLVNFWWCGRLRRGSRGSLGRYLGSWCIRSRWGSSCRWDFCLKMADLMYCWESSLRRWVILWLLVTWSLRSLHRRDLGSLCPSGLRSRRGRWVLQRALPFPSLQFWSLLRRSSPTSRPILVRFLDSFAIASSTPIACCAGCLVFLMRKGTEGGGGGREEE